MPYIDPAQPYAVRQETLKATYGFNCRCPRCIADEAIQDSIPQAPEDSAEFVNLHGALIAYVFGPDPAAIDDLQELPELCGDPLPENLLLLKNDAHLPFLSARFRDAAHDGDDTVARESGLALLALYLSIYPAAYPLIGPILYLYYVL